MYYNNKYALYVDHAEIRSWNQQVLCNDGKHRAQWKNARICRGSNSPDNHLPLTKQPLYHALPPSSLIVCVIVCVYAYNFYYISC